MRTRPKPVNDWAENEARKLIATEFRNSGCEGNAKQYENEKTFTTAPLRAFASYIRRQSYDPHRSAVT